MEEIFIKRLMASIKCTVCGKCYDIDDVNVLGHHDDLWFLRTLCSSCNAQCLVAVVVKEEEVLEVITDLTEVELERFKDRSQLTGDEVLDMHSFLKDFDGDFSQFFGQQELQDKN